MRCRRRAPETIKRELTLCFPIFAVTPVLRPFSRVPLPPCGFGGDLALNPLFVRNWGSFTPWESPDLAWNPVSL